MGHLDRRLMHGSLGPLESSTQTASRSVHPYLQGLVRLTTVTGRQTDRSRYSVRNNRRHLPEAAMRPNNSTNDNVYGAVIMVRPLPAEFTWFFWWMPGGRQLSNQACI